MSNDKKTRRQQILEALARMLEASPGARITTAALAGEVGVSEAALYRHFPSKAKMFEGLIEFIEDTVFSRVNAISAEPVGAFVRCEKIMFLVLAFAEKNPGITRILTGDALAGETDKLRVRVVQLFDRLETQLRQILRDAELREGLRFELSIAHTVNLMMCAMEGKISQFVRSDFKRRPTDAWPEQWACIASGLLVVGVPS